jgi:hypothetical protein
MDNDLGVVDMFFGPIAPKSLRRDFEFSSSVAKSDEGETPEQDTNGFSRELLQATNIDSLGVVTEPVAKVNSLDVELLKLLAAAGGYNQLQKSIFNVAVAIVDAIDLSGVLESSLRRWGLESVRWPHRRYLQLRKLLPGWL